MEMNLEQLCKRAHDARIKVGMLEGDVKNETLRRAADALLAHEEDILAANEKSVNDYKNGKTNALGYLVGQCMKASKGKANPGIVKEIITKYLND